MNTKKGRVFATSDWHGCINVANKVFEWLKPEDHLYFLGDAIDRGPAGIEIFNKLYDMPNVTMICGNHEQMFKECYTQYLYWRKFPDTKQYPLLYNWFIRNGGYATALELDSLTDEEVKELAYKINTLQCGTHYNNINNQIIYMEHAGFTPTLTPYRTHDALWDRSHFSDEWSKENIYNDIYIVHGHTPVQSMKYDSGYNGQPPFTIEEFKAKKDWENGGLGKEPTIIRYCSGHKFNIDMCTAYSNTIALLDLDTFAEIYFKGDITNESN